MGIYSGNRTSLGSIDLSTIVADESYNGAEGAARILIENVQNEQALFEAVISNDFEEAYIANESGDVRAIYALQEASMGGLFEKIKAFIKKIMEKIKGLFQSFMARVNGAITRDNKQLVNKYKGVILKKDCSKMEYKWSKPKESLSNAALSVDAIKTKLDGHLEIALTAMKGDKALDKLRERISDDEILESMLGSAVQPSGNYRCVMVDFDKEYHERFFEDEEKEENFDTIKSDVMTVLVNASDAMKVAKKFVDNTEKLCRDALKRVDNANSKVMKLIPKDTEKSAGIDDSDLYSDGRKASPGGYGKIGGGMSHEDVNKALNVASSILSVAQTALTKTSSAYMREVQFEIKQNRRVWIQAAAYNPKKTESMDVLFDAIEESVDYEVSSDFETIMA